jgi:glycosyltransferase involved in cell wall biosynthesis
MQLSMTLNYQRLAKNAPTWFHKALYTIEYQKLQRFEADFARSFDKVMLISPRDLEAMAAEPPLPNVFFNPHGVDFDYFAPDPQVEKETNTLIFSGNMKYMPNIDAITYFCKEILPLIRQRIPDVRLYIVGTRPVSEVLALGEDPAITVTGRVPDLRTYLNRAQVAIAPMRIVAGLLNKVLEGMSMGLPMVVTPQANEGIRAEDGTQLLIADTPQYFADQVVDLLKDPARRQQVGAAAREFILNQWSWEGHLGELEQMFCDLVEHSSHQPQATAAPSDLHIRSVRPVVANVLSEEG